MVKDNPVLKDLISKKLVSEEKLQKIRDNLDDLQDAEVKITEKEFYAMYPELGRHSDTIYKELT